METVIVIYTLSEIALLFFLGFLPLLFIEEITDGFITFISFIKNAIK